MNITSVTSGVKSSTVIESIRSTLSKLIATPLNNWLHSTLPGYEWAIMLGVAFILAMIVNRNAGSSNKGSMNLLLTVLFYVLFLWLGIGNYTE